MTAPGEARRERSKVISAIRRRVDRGLISQDELWEQIAVELGAEDAALGQELAGVRGVDWDLLEYVKKLKENYKTGVLSNASAGFIEKLFDENRPLENYFDHVVASGETGFLKPDRRCYREILARLAVSPSAAVYTDDNESYCAAAEASGMKAMVYKNFPDFKRQLEAVLSFKRRAT